MRALFVGLSAALLGQAISLANNPGYTGRVAVLVLVFACYLGLWTSMADFRIEGVSALSVALAVACDLRYWNIVRAEFMEFGAGVLIGSLLVAALPRYRLNISDRVQRLLTLSLAATLTISAVFGHSLADALSRPAFPILSGLVIIGSWIPVRVRTIDIGALFLMVAFAVPSQFTSGLALFPVTAAAFAALNSLTKHSVSLSRFATTLAIVAIIGSTTYESAIILWRKAHPDHYPRAEKWLDHA
jgi:hypothetical protein